MKKYFFLIIGLAWVLTTTPLEDTTVITHPEYCGKLYGGFTWLHLKSMPTDSDLEIGTFITLTAPPPNLFACLKQLQSKPSNAFRLSLGYNIPSTNANIDFAYFHYKGSDSSQIKNIQLNQLIQNFLGGAYSTLDATENQKINQVDTLIGKRFIIDRHLLLHPYLGLAVANISRDMNVEFTGLIDAPPGVTNSLLTGLEKSKYWGLGPIFGSNFSFSIFKCLSLQGIFGGGISLGNIKSSIDAVEKNDQNSTTIITTFNAAESNFRVMPLIKSQLAFTFHPTLKSLNIDCECNVGYEIDFYFNVIDRINPFNGFVINQNSFPVKKSSHLSVGGPFIKLLIRSSDDKYFDYFDYSDNCHNHYTHSCYYFYDLYGEFTSLWLKPVSNNGDLVYAVLNTENGGKKNQKASFKHSWVGYYKLGYHTLDNCDFNLSFLRLHDQNSTQVTAGNGENISSVNASGSDSVTYSAAQSKVTYNLNQGEFLAGKWFSPLCKLQMLLSCGLRGSSLKRRIQNQYTGGIPALNFESKFNTLKSDFHGVGPAFSMRPYYSLHENFQLTGYLSTSLLMGRLKSTLDQINRGTVGESSNTLRTPNTRWAIPVVDASAGLSYRHCLFSKINMKIEAGYQFLGYFKAINLVFPNFLTGLGQNNSDLKLHGPYLNIKFGFAY